ncbi:hypothetical protein E2C01_026346 [Portunus trituberculatus]|uniref:Transmembrane protein n=1 Tax=Portunus trituberculatus TaxID=210409 RepID=A0A5B7EI16_PORTR|nr:hypothetical protein [Portunus trituberculatus]
MMESDRQGRDRRVVGIGWVRTKTRRPILPLFFLFIHSYYYHYYRSYTHFPLVFDSSSPFTRRPLGFHSPLALILPLF